jgi:hypothetical protein
LALLDEYHRKRALKKPQSPVVFLVLVAAGFGITLSGVVGLVRTKGA